MSKANGAAGMAVREATATVEEKTTGNGKVTTITQVVQVKAMGTKEKERIEVLIQRRARELTDYMEEMRAAVTQANNLVVPDTQTEINRIEIAKTKKKIELDHIDNARKGKEAAAIRVLTEARDRKMRRLEAMIAKLKSTHEDDVAAVKEQVQEEYAAKQAELAAEMTKFDQELKELERQAKIQKSFRQIALENSFTKLRMDIADRQNRAVERLWTDVVIPEHAKEALAALPDSSSFREVVSPERMFEVFNSSLDQSLRIEESVVKCHYCAKSTMEMRNGRMYCTHCGRYKDVTREVRDIVALPSLTDVLNRSQELAGRQNDVLTIEGPVAAFANVEE